MPFSKNWYHIERSQLTGLNAIRYFTGWYPEQNIFTTTAINCRIIFVLYDQNSTNQNLRYRHKERMNTEGNLKESKP